MFQVVAVAAIGKNRVLGKENKLLWHIPDDLKRFREITSNHPIIMGRKTFESILGYTGGKPLPNRTNIVVTRDPSWAHEGALVASSPLEALEKARALDSELVSIGGGAQIFAELLPQTTRLALTLIDAEAEGDAFFPEYEHEFTREVFRETREWQGLTYTWVDLER